MQHIFKSRRRLLMVACLVLCGLMLPGTGPGIAPAAAAPFSVNNTNDSGAGSLRQAITNANVSSGDDTISFDVPGAGPHAITLSSALPALSSNISILNDRSGDEAVTVQRSTAAGTPDFQVFFISNGTATGPTVTIAGLTISHGSANGSDPLNAGGGIFNDAGTLTVRACTLSQNSATYGGGIYNGAGTLTLTGCSLSQNSATYGGGIDSTGALTLTGCSLSQNSAGADGYGGGLLIQANAVVSNCTFSSNSARYGGGLYSGSYAVSAALSNCTFSSNSAESGGGVYNYGGLTLTGCTLSNNTTTVGDGGIYNGATLTLNGCTFTNNSTTPTQFSRGGGIYNNGFFNSGTGTLTLTDCTLNGNSAANHGGGLASVGSNATLTLTGCLLRNNAGGQYGGGFYNDGGKGSLAGCTFSGNTATGQFGGGLYNTDFNGSPTLTLADCTFSSNSARFGGGLYNYSFRSGIATLALSNCTLDSNSAESFGGGLDNASNTDAASTARATLTNCTLSSNVAPYGGGCYNFAYDTDSTLTLTNCTLAQNSSTFSGSSIYNDQGTVSTGNTIFYRDSGVGNLGSAGTGTFTSRGHNLSSDAAGGDAGSGPGGFLNGTGDIRNTDPLLGPLRGNGGVTSTRALLPGSPVLDKGDDAVLGAPLNLTTDQRGSGFPRKIGAHVDIGAFEQAVFQSGPTYLVNTLAEHDDSACGVTDCTLLEALNAANANANANTINFQAGLTGTIKNTLLPAGLAITNPLAINGPGARILTISGNGTARVFNVASGVSATISGLTIANGNASGTDNGGGIANAGTLTLTNSTISGNSAFAGGGIRNDFGGILTINNSTISGNLASIGGAGILNNGTLTITNTTVSGNMANSGNGGGIVGGTVSLTNSTISGNSASSNGGGVFNNGTNGGAVSMRNTIIALNTAPSAPDVYIFGTLTSEGFNLIGNSSGASITPAQSSDQIGVTAAQLKLGPLQNNGGPTDTLALLGGSPAIDAGKAFGLATDQRGQARPFDQPGTANVDDGGDIGAYERGAVALSISDATVIEGAGGTTTLATFIVNLLAPSTQTVTVDYATANDSAVANNDYTAKSGTLTFQPGQTSKTIVVGVNGDNKDESDERFFANLSNAGNAAIADAQGIGTIIDDDPLPTLSISDVQAMEGAPGVVTQVAFTVTLGSVSGRLVTVDFNNSDGTATTGNGDYIPKTGTVKFLPGQTSKQAYVAIQGDRRDEDNETFFVNLLNPVNATIADNQGTVTITDDDPPPSIAIANVTVTEGASGTTTNAVFTLSLSAPSSHVVTVDCATANSSAVSPGDYTAKTGTVTFQIGQTSKTFSVAVKGDAVDEVNERFFVNLSNAVNGTIGDAQGIGTITDDDGPAALQSAPAPPDEPSA